VAEGEPCVTVECRTLDATAGKNEAIQSFVVKRAEARRISLSIDAGARK
jgi:hypothetical protein